VAQEVEVGGAKPDSEHDLVLYLLIAFGWTWLLWLPSVLISLTDNRSLMYWMHDVEVSFGLFFLVIGAILSTFGPLVGAFTMTGLRQGRQGARDLWRRFWDVRRAGPWLAVGFLLPVLLVALPVVVSAGGRSRLPWLSRPYLIPCWFLNNFTRSGGMSEEFGWRGYALPRLQERTNALAASMILGVIWAVWHVPLWFLPGSSQQGSSFWAFLAALVLISVLYTWLYNNSRGSVLVVVVFHAMNNTMAQMFPGATSRPAYWIVLVALVVLVLLVYGPRRLARERGGPPFGGPGRLS
jgi:membrane protease YdiL (CAAX protease family)